MASGYKNALPLLSQEDVPDASFIYTKVEKHTVYQLRRWLACHGIKTLLDRKALFEVTNTAPFTRLTLTVTLPAAI